MRFGRYLRMFRPKSCVPYIPQKIPKPKKAYIYTHEQIKTILSEMKCCSKNPEICLRYYTMTGILAFTGIRINDCLDLNIEDWNSKEKIISENTIASYSDCMRLLFSFTADKLGTTVDKLDIEMIDDELVLEFLDYLEKSRENKVKTRNHSLTVIKTFFKFLAEKVPTLINACNKIVSIKQKKTEHKNILPMSDDELKAFFNAIDLNSNHGKRDHALFSLMYNAGARVQEIADIKIQDIRFKPPYIVNLHGKGNKDRTVCLYEETAESIRKYISCERTDADINKPLFLNKYGNKFNRAGIFYLVKEYVKKAALEAPSILSRNISPHTFRHTVAFGIIESGNDITVVKDWLGHESITTAAMYVKISTQMKLEVLKKITPKNTENCNIEKKWKVPEVMTLLKKLSLKKEILC